MNNKSKHIKYVATYYHHTCVTTMFLSYQISVIRATVKIDECSGVSQSKILWNKCTLLSYGAKSFFIDSVYVCSLLFDKSMFNFH